MKKLTLSLFAVAVSFLGYSALKKMENTTSGCISGSIGVCVHSSTGKTCSTPVNTQNNDCTGTISFPDPPPPSRN